MKFKKVSNSPMNLERLKTNIFVIGGVLIERIHDYAILSEEGRTIR